MDKVTVTVIRPTVTTPAFKFENLGSQINRGISAIFYSDPGVGKTKLATTLPEGKTLIMTCEAGLGPLLGTKHIVFDVLKAINPDTHNMEDIIMNMYRYLRTEKHPFENVVLDNLSEMEQQLILNLTKKHKKDVPEIREYGDASYIIKDWVHLYRDLVFKNMNVVFNAWEFPLELKNAEGSMITRIYHLIGKKIAPQICGIVDVVGRLECNAKTGQRRIRLDNNDQFITKSQFSGLDKAEPANLTDLFSKLKEYVYGEK